MNVYIWIAAMGIIGMLALILFIYFLIKDLKLKGALSYSFWKMVPNWLLMFFSIGSFSMMVYFFLNVKDQLVQFGR